MNRDVTLEKIPKGESPYILNGVPAEDYGTITNEKGNTTEVTLPSGTQIIGNCLLDDNRQVLFCVNGTNSAIYIKDKDTYTTVVSPTTVLNFAITNQIEAVFRRDYKGDYIVYWTDNLNAPRFLNVSNPPTLSLANINTISLFNSYARPKFDLTDVSIGGSLKSGVYQLFIQYLDNTDNPTDFIGASDIIPISDATADQRPYKYGGSLPGSPTNKKISMRLFNLDTNYSKIKVAAIYYNDGVIETPKVFATYTITGTTMDIVYTGNESYESTPLAEILSLFAKYKTAKTITSFENVLYLGNLSSSVDLGLQKYVNNITVDYELYNSNVASNSTSFNRETVIYNNKGFMQDDVYSLYISYVLKDGSQTKAYHIPGRPKKNISKYRLTGANLSEDTLVSTAKSTWSYPGQRSIPDNVLDEAIAVNSNAKWFQFFGTNNNANSVDSNLGYWENQNEVYPDTGDWDIYSLDPVGNPLANGTLRNEKVRHHKMPEPEIKASTDTTYLNSGSVGAIGNVVGLRIKNIPIPANVFDQVAGYKIYYAKKDQGNSLVLAQDVAKFNATNNDTSPDYTQAWTMTGGNYNIKYIIGSPGPDYEIKSGISFRLHDFNCLANDLDISAGAWVKSIGAMQCDPYDYASPGEIEGKSSDFTEVVDTEAHPSTWFNSTDTTWKTRTTEYVRKIKTIFYLDTQSVSNAYSNKNVYNTSQNIYNYKGEKSIFVEVNNAFSLTAFSLNSDRTINQALLLNVMAYKEDVFNSFDNQELVECYYSEATSPGFYVYSKSIRNGDTFFGINTYRVACQIGELLSYDSVTGKNLRHGYVIPHTSRSNPLFRHNDSEIGENYYPKIPFVTGTAAGFPLLVADAEGLLEYTLDKDNYWGYNKDYSRGNNIIQPEIFSKSITSDSTKYYTRVIRSNKQSLESIIDAYRQFPVNNYVDLDQDRGQIEVIKRDSSSLIIHLTNALTKTVARQVLKTDNVNAYIGNGDIFEIPNKEIRYSELGYGGTQSQWSNIITPYGYIFPDSKNRKMMLLGEGFSDIGKGLTLFFNENLGFNILNDFPFVNVDNPANPQALGFLATWDNIYRRYILTKRDYKATQTLTAAYIGRYDDYPTSPTFGTIIYYNPTQTFKLFQFPSGWADLPFSDTRYFEDKSFTLSYYPEMQSWFSFHSYIPLYYMYDQNEHWSAKDNVIWKHLSGDRCRYYSTLNRFIIDVPFNDAPNKSKIFDSVQYISKYVIGGVEYPDRTFSKFNAYSNNCLSGETAIVNLDTARSVNSTWNINSFRDLRADYNSPILTGVNITGTINSNKSDIFKKRFFDNYMVMRLIHSNEDNAKLSLVFSSTKARIKER